MTTAVRFELTRVTPMDFKSIALTTRPSCREDQPLPNANALPKLFPSLNTTPPCTRRACRRARHPTAPMRAALYAFVATPARAKLYPTPAAGTPLRHGHAMSRRGQSDTLKVASHNYKKLPPDKQTRTTTCSNQTATAGACSAQAGTKNVDTHRTASPVVQSRDTHQQTNTSRRVETAVHVPLSDQ